MEGNSTIFFVWKNDTEVIERSLIIYAIASCGLQIVPWLGTDQWQLGFKNSENEDFSYLSLQKKDCTMLLVVTHWENKRDKAHSIKTDWEELLRKPIHTIVTEEQN